MNDDSHTETPEETTQATPEKATVSRLQAAHEAEAKAQEALAECTAERKAAEAEAEELQKGS